LIEGLLHEVKVFDLRVFREKGLPFKGSISHSN